MGGDGGWYLRRWESRKIKDSIVPLCRNYDSRETPRSNSTNAVTEFPPYRRFVALRGFQRRIAHWPFRGGGVGGTLTGAVQHHQ